MQWWHSKSHKLQPKRMLYWQSRSKWREWRRWWHRNYIVQGFGQTSGFQESWVGHDESANGVFCWYLCWILCSRPEGCSKFHLNFTTGRLEHIFGWWAKDIIVVLSLSIILQAKSLTSVSSQQMPLRQSRARTSLNNWLKMKVLLLSLIIWTMVSLLTQIQGWLWETWTNDQFQCSWSSTSEWRCWAQYQNCCILGTNQFAPCGLSLATTRFDQALANGHQLCCLGIQSLTMCWYGPLSRWNVVSVSNNTWWFATSTCLGLPSLCSWASSPRWQEDTKVATMNTTWYAC